MGSDTHHPLPEGTRVSGTRAAGASRADEARGQRESTLPSLRPPHESALAYGLTCMGYQVQGAQS